jgi:hypothetical protein
MDIKDVAENLMDNIYNYFELDKNKLTFTDHETRYVLTLVLLYFSNNRYDNSYAKNDIVSLLDDNGYYYHFIIRNFKFSVRKGGKTVSGEIKKYKRYES